MKESYEHRLETLVMQGDDNIIDILTNKSTEEVLEYMIRYRKNVALMESKTKNPTTLAMMFKNMKTIEAYYELRMIRDERDRNLAVQKNRSFSIG